MELKKKKIILVSNVTDHSGPTEGLAGFLQKNSAVLATIYHPFFYCRDRQSKCRLFIKGKLVEEEISQDLSLPEFLKYAVDLLLTLYFTFRLKQKYDLFIGVNCLHALVGIIYKKLRIVNEVIFYTIDWVPQRFKNPFFNKLYYGIDQLAIRGADYVWNLSEEITKIREKQKVPTNKNLLVPNGVNFSQIKKMPLKKIQRQTLVLLGALHESKGVDLVLKSLPGIWKEFPGAKIVVIGTTPKVAGIKPYEQIFRSLGERVSILGALPHEEILSLLPKMGIGLSPYRPEIDNLSRYAWPARVIDYLACGLPVIITSVPAVAQEIRKGKAGVMIKYAEEELSAAVKKLFTDDEFYFAARENAFDLVKHLSWNNIFRKAFAEMYGKRRAN